jgi:hypothetical protein
LFEPSVTSKDENNKELFEQYSWSFGCAYNVLIDAENKRPFYWRIIKALVKKAVVLKKTKHN